ncbi:MAG: hypothetical protein V1726_07535 [Methanobacteriota archaeon]
MKALYLTLIILGIIIFIVSLLGGGLLFVIPIPSIYLNILWLIGLVLVAIGLLLNEKEKKKKT